MPYSIRLPDGSLVQNIPDEITPQEAKARILQRRPDLLQATPKKETTVLGEIGEGVKGVVPGAVGLLESAAVGASALLPDEMEKSARETIKDVASAAKKPFAAEAGYEDSVGRKLGEAIGSTVPFLAAGPLGWAGRVAAGAMGVGAGTGEARVRAEQAGATEGERAAATAAGIVPGILEMAPPFRIFQRLHADELAGALPRLRRIAAAGGEEALQEATSGFLQNLIAKGIYKPEQELVEGLGEQAAYGGGTGAVLQGIMDLALGRRARGAGTTQPETDEEKLALEREVAAKLQGQPTTQAPAAQQELPLTEEAAPPTPSVRMEEAGAGPVAPEAEPTLTERIAARQPTMQMPLMFEEGPAAEPTLRKPGQKAEPVLPDALQAEDFPNNSRNWAKTTKGQEFIATVSALTPEEAIAQRKKLVGKSVAKGDIFDALVPSVQPASYRPESQPRATEPSVAAPSGSGVAVGDVPAPTTTVDTGAAQEPVGTGVDVGEQPAGERAGAQVAQPSTLTATQIQDEIRTLEEKQRGLLYKNGRAPNANTQKRAEFDAIGAQIEERKAAWAEADRAERAPAVAQTDTTQPAVPVAEAAPAGVEDLVSPEAAPQAAPGREPQKGGSSATLFDQTEVEKNRTPEYKGRTKLVEIPIKDFLALSEEGVTESKTESVQALVNEGKKFSSLPFLIIDSDGRVEGHEGRHRARALMDAGYTTMPVILRSANIRWSEQTNPENFDYVEEWPQSLTAQSGAADQTFSTPFPVSREQADQPYAGDSTSPQAAPQAAPVVSNAAPEVQAADNLIQAVTTTKDNTDYINAINRMQFAIESEETAPRTKEILTKWVGAQKQRDTGFAKSYDAIQQNRVAKQRQLEGSQRQREQEKKGQQRDDRKASVNAQIEMKLEELVKKGDLRGALQLIATNLDRSDVRRLVAERLLKSKSLPRLSAAPALVDESGDPRAAAYDAVADEVLVREPSIHAILHESVHGFVHRLIADVEAGNKTNDGVADLQRLYDYLKKNHPQMMKGEYAALNLSEFASEVMSNEGFQRELRRITLKTNKQNAFTAFARAVMRALGIRMDGDKTNALAEAVIAVESILDKGRATAMRGVGKEVAGGQNVMPLAKKFTTNDLIVDSSELNNKPNWFVEGARMMTNGMKSESGVSAVDKFRAYVADVAAPIETRLNTLFDGKVRSVLGIINPMGLFRQAQDHQKLLVTFMEDGSLVKDATTGLYRTDKVAGVPTVAEGLAAIKQWGDSKGLDFEGAFASLSKLAEARRLAEMRKANIELTAKGEPALPIHKLSKKDPRSADEQIDDQLAKLAANPGAEPILKLFDDIRFKLVDKMVEVGRLTAEEGDFWKANAGYIPFDRIGKTFDNFKSRKGALPRGVAQLGKLPEYVGTTELEVGNVFENSIKTYGWMIGQVLHQDATSTTLRVLEAMDNAKKMPWQEPPSGTDMTTIVQTYEKGKPAFYKLPTRWDKAAFAPAAVPMGAFVRIMRPFSNMLRTTITAMPPFALKQVTDDIQRAMMHSGVKKPFNLIWPALKTFASVSYAEVLGKEHPAVKQFGQFGIVGDYDLNTMNPAESVLADLGYRSRGKARTLLHRLEGITRASDLAVRKAVYEQTMKETNDELLARTRARELINFRRQGGGAAMPAILSTIPFANAYIQGMDVMYRAAFGKGGPSSDARAAARKMFLTRAATVTAISAIYAIMKSGDDEYEEMDLRTRHNNWILGGGYKLAVPGEYAAVFKVPAEMAIEYLRRSGTPEEIEGTEAAITALKYAFEQYGGRMNPVPAAIRPVIETLTNYSFFTGEQLVGTYQQQLDPSRQRRSNTTELAIAIADFTRNQFNAEVSPIHIDTFLQSYFGSVASNVTMATDALLNPNRLDRPLHKYMLLSNYLYDPEVGTRRIAEFYEAREKFASKKATLDRLAKTDVDKAVAYAEEHQFELSMAQGINISLQQLENVRAHKTYLQSDQAAKDGMTQEERRAQLEELRKADVEITRWLREVQNELKKAQ